MQNMYLFDFRCLTQRNREQPGHIHLEPVIRRSRFL